jgi:LysR family carnitine catabolism transcriptional activator
MNLSGRLIDAFLALEETRRFSIAAERCHMSASAFSQMIGRLEETVGVRLFDRDTRNVSLTPEGEVFAQGARRITSEIKASLAELQDRAALRTGRVAIASPASVAAAWIPSVLAAFRADHPGVALQLHDVVSEQCLRLVLSGEVDFGLNASQGNPTEFESHLLSRESLHLVCRRDDPLAGRAEVRLRELRQRPFIHTVRSGSVWQVTQPLIRRAEMRDSGFEVAQFGTLASLVEAGFGISIVPRFALPLCERPTLTHARVIARDAFRPLYLIKRRARSLSDVAQSLWHRIQAKARVRDEI